MRARPAPRPLPWVLLLAALLVVVAPLAAQQREEPPENPRFPKELFRPQPPPEEPADDPQDGEEPPMDSGLVERAEVALAEFKVLVTDRRGRPIVDLKPEEIRVFEGGVEQKLAYLEPVTGGRPRPTGTAEIPPPAMLYTSEGEAVASEPEAVLPPKPVRRVVLAFDVRNSKLNARDTWKEAALEWLIEGMQPEDLVGIVVFRSYPDWVVEFTRDRKRLKNALESLSLVGSAPDRDRRRDMNKLIEEMQSLCSDPGKAITQRNRGSPDYRREDSSFDEVSCSYSIASEFVQQWDLEAQESIEVMRTLTGQLAAIPGRKAVILFSDGLVADASMLGAYALTAVLGTTKVDLGSTAWRLRRSSTRELDKLYSVAQAGDVSFFTFDTRRGDQSGFGGQLEMGQHLNYQKLGVNPWTEMHSETRGTLNTLAKETGGRSFHGIKRLEENVRAAADSFFGFYAVGYYREDPAAEPGKVRVKIERDKLMVDYPDKARLWPHRPREVALDLSIGAPRLAADGERQTLPVSLLMAFDALPLRRGAGGRGTVLGAHIQAIRPDGTVAAERLEIVEVVATRAERQEAEDKAYRHLTSITLPTGAFRLRVRISDDRQAIVADRTIDLTLELGRVEPGLREIAAASAG